MYNIIIYIGDSFSIVLYVFRGFYKLCILYLWNLFYLFDCNISYVFIVELLNIKLKII